jgi:hypothetical protein
MILSIVAGLMACVHREPPALDTWTFERGLALHPILPSATGASGTTHMASLPAVRLAQRLPNDSSRLELVPGLDLSCSIEDGRLSVFVTSTLVVTERTDLLARCVVSDLEVPVWVTVEPSEPK